MNGKTYNLKSGKNDNILDIFINLLNMMNIDHNPLQVNYKIKDFLFDIKDYFDIISDFDFHDSVNFIKKKMLNRKTNTEAFNEFDVFKALNTFKSFVDFASDKIDNKNYGIKTQKGGFNKNIIDKKIKIIDDIETNKIESTEPTEPTESTDSIESIESIKSYKLLKNSKNLKGGALGELDILAYFSGEKEKK